MTDITSVKGSLVHKFGYGSVGTSYGPLEPLGSFNWLTAADSVRVKAGGNAADTAAGAGARSVRIYGLDANFNPIDETVDTAGASASASTSAEFIRVFRAKVVDAGAYTVGNTGAMTIETEGGTDLLSIQAGEGQSQYGAYTIPAGKTGHVHSVHLFVDSTKATDIRAFARERADVVAAPFQAAQLKLFWPGQGEEATLLPRTPIAFKEKTDLWFEAKVSSTTANVAVDFEIELTG